MTPVPTTSATQRAVNLADLLHEHVAFAKALLRPVLTQQQVAAERTIDGAALLVEPTVPAERWSAIHTIIRNGTSIWPPIPIHTLRIYERRGGRWTRI